MSSSGKLVAAVVLMTALAGMLGANLHRSPTMLLHQWKLGTTAPLEVSLEPAKRGYVLRTIEAPGQVEADVEVEISSRVMGRILELPIKEGDPVTKGDLLVRLDSADYEAEVRSAEARSDRLQSSIKLMQLELQKSERDLQRNKLLAERGALRSTDLEDATTLTLKDESRLAMSKAELVEAEAFLSKATENLGYTKIHSPLTGIVSQLKAEEGEVVVVGTTNVQGTVLLVVSDPNTMIVRARVDETDVPLVQVGQTARIYLQAREEEAITGIVKRISPKGRKDQKALGAVSDSDVAVFETIIEIPKPPEHMRLGMSANVAIEVDAKSHVVLAPSRAVLHRRPKDLPARITEVLKQQASDSTGNIFEKRFFEIVYVDADGVSQCRLVQTGISDGRMVEIIDGLAEGETVVTGPYRMLDRLADGKPIKLLEAPAADARPVTARQP